MATPQHSIIFWAPPVNAEPTLLVGDVVIPDDDGSGDWVIASAANRGTRGSEGVALSVTGGSGFGSVEIQSAGVLDATTSGLAAGAKQLVRVSSAGRIERIASYTAGDDVIGHAEADGRVHLHFGLPWGDIAALAGGTGLPPGWYNIEDYGGVGDGVTDNTAAFHAMLAAMSPDFAFGLTAYIPPGSFYFADNVWVYKQICIRTATTSGVGNGDCELVFAAGKQLIIPQDGSPYGGKGEGSAINGLIIRTTKVTQPEWAAATAYVVGDRVHLPTSDVTMSDLSGDAFTQGKIGTNWAYLECIVAGTSHAATVPTATFEPDFSANLVPLQQYYSKNVVRGRTGGNLITSVVFVCTTEGIAGGSEPTWNTTPGATTASGTAVFTAYSSADWWVTDGTVVWACKVHAGLLLKARAHIEDCFIEGSTNGGITVRAGSPLNNSANHWTANRVRIRQCGIGLCASGSDANVANVMSIDIEGAGAGVTGQGGYGILDRSQLGNTYVACHVANDAASGGGPSYRGGDGSNWTVFVNCYSESWGGGVGRGLYIRSIIKYPALTLLGAWGSGYYDSDTRVGIHEGGDQGVLNLVGRVNAAAGGGKVEGYLGSRGDGSKAFRWGKSTYPSTDLSGVSHSTALAWPATDWWTMGYHTAVGDQSLAMPGYGAVWPVSGAVVTTKGAAWIPQSRVFVGAYDADPPSIGYATAQPTSGHYVLGSIVFDLNASAGGDIGWRCTASTTYTSPTVVNTEATWETIPWPSAGSGAPTDATYVTLGTNATLTNERVITAGSGISLTDNGAGSTLVIAATGGSGAPVGATYVTISLDGTLTNERTLAAGTNMSLSDGGANGAVTLNCTGTFLTAAGNSDEIQTKGSGNALAAATNVRAVSGAVIIGSGTAATIGSLRFPSASTVVGSMRNSINTADLVLFATNNSDGLYIGTDTSFTTANQVSLLNLFAVTGGYVQIGLGGTGYCRAHAGVMKAAVPRHGDSQPFGSEGAATISLAGLGSYTLVAAEYSLGIWIFTGTPSGDGIDITIPRPAGASDAYKVMVHHTGTLNIDLVHGGGSLTLAAGACRSIYVTSSSIVADNS